MPIGIRLHDGKEFRPARNMGFHHADIMPYRRKVNFTNCIPLHKRACFLCLSYKVHRDFSGLRSSSHYTAIHSKKDVSFFPPSAHMP